MQKYKMDSDINLCLSLTNNNASVNSTMKSIGRCKGVTWGWLGNLKNLEMCKVIESTHLGSKTQSDAVTARELASMHRQHIQT